MKRSLIMIIGASGSGKTTLGRNAAENLRADMSVEHISTGNLVRHIGTGAIKSTHYQTLLNHLNSPKPNERFANEVVSTIIGEALDRTDADLVLLDGAPRTAEQLSHVSELVARDSRHLAGAILAFVATKETGIARLLKRYPRDFSQQMSYDQAAAQIAYSSAPLEQVEDALTMGGIPLRYVETSGPKVETATYGASAIRSFI